MCYLQALFLFIIFTTVPSWCSEVPDPDTKDIEKIARLSINYPKPVRLSPYSKPTSRTLSDENDYRSDIENYLFQGYPVKPIFDQYAREFKSQEDKKAISDIKTYAKTSLGSPFSHIFPLPDYFDDNIDNSFIENNTENIINFFTNSLSFDKLIYHIRWLISYRSFSYFEQVIPMEKVTKSINDILPSCIKDYKALQKNYTQQSKLGRFDAPLVLDTKDYIEQYKTVLSYLLNDFTLEPNQPILLVPDIWDTSDKRMHALIRLLQENRISPFSEFDHDKREPILQYSFQLPLNDELSQKLIEACLVYVLSTNTIKKMYTDIVMPYFSKLFLDNPRLLDNGTFEMQYPNLANFLNQIKDMINYSDIQETVDVYVNSFLAPKYAKAFLNLFSMFDKFIQTKNDTLHSFFENKYIRDVIMSIKLLLDVNPQIWAKVVDNKNKTFFDLLIEQFDTNIKFFSFDQDSQYDYILSLIKLLEKTDYYPKIYEKIQNKKDKDTAHFIESTQLNKPKPTKQELKEILEKIKIINKEVQEEKKLKEQEKEQEQKRKEEELEEKLLEREAEKEQEEKIRSLQEEQLQEEIEKTEKQRKMQKKILEEQEKERERLAAIAFLEAQEAEKREEERIKKEKELLEQLEQKKLKEATEASKKLEEQELQKELEKKEQQKKEREEKLKEDELRKTKLLEQQLVEEQKIAQKMEPLPQSLEPIEEEEQQLVEEQKIAQGEKIRSLQEEQLPKQVQVETQQKQRKITRKTSIQKLLNTEKKRQSWLNRFIGVAGITIVASLIYWYYHTRFRSVH